MNCKDIIIEKLKALGADGLYRDLGSNSGEDNCGCGIDDLITCGGDCSDCMPAKKSDGAFVPLDDKKTKNGFIVVCPECGNNGALITLRITPTDTNEESSIKLLMHIKCKHCGHCKKYIEGDEI